MKIARRLPIRTILALSVALSLSGCGEMPFGAQGQQYHPLDSEVAQMAAPQAPQAAPPLYCRIGRGDAHFAKGWSPYVDPSFTLAPDARVTIPIASAKGVASVQMLGIFDTQGQKLIFCPFVDGPPDKRVACTSLYALDDDLKAGIKRTFDVPAALRGAEITCAYDQKALQKL
jgi:hypothetical protein